MVGKTQGAYAATYAYRFGDKLKAATSNFPGETASVGYNYDGLGRRRLEQRDNTTATWFRWSGLEECGEYAGTVGSWTIGALQTGYVPGLATFAGSNPATAEWRYHLTDHLGCVRQLSGQNKAALARYDYAPYGELMRNAGLPLTVGYTGHLWDSAIGQYYAPFRYYNPQTARWNMRDPLGFVDGPNVYAYVARNPVNEFDPFGLQAASVCMIAIGPSLPSLSSMVSVLVGGAGSIGVFLTTLPVSVPVVVAGVLVGATAAAIIGINIYAKQSKHGGRKPKNNLPTNVENDIAKTPREEGESPRKYADRLRPDGPYGPGTDHNKIKKHFEEIDRMNRRNPCKK